MAAKVPNRIEGSSKPLIKKDVMYNLMIFAILSSTIAFAFLSSNMLLSLYDLSKIVLLFVCVPFLIPMKIHKKIFHFGRIEAAILNVAFGLFLLASCSFLNKAFASGEETEKHKINNRVEEWNRFAGSTMLVTLKQDAYKDFPEFRRFELTDDNSEILDKKKLIITKTKGLFGVELVVERELK